jgi:16S rRNA (adenine1518-N6/adenine1519-N6)-dimethyltransferase
VAEKIKTDADKKSFLWWLLNYNYEVKYLKTVPPKAFNPPPKVDSAYVLFKKKENQEIIDFTFLINFLNYFSPYKRKTLNKIQKMLQKKGIIYDIPVNLQKNRLEELSRIDIISIKSVN